MDEGKLSKNLEKDFYRCAGLSFDIFTTLHTDNEIDPNKNLEKYYIKAVDGRGRPVKIVLF